MDARTLESIFKPWWLSRPAFMVAMILASALCLGVLALEWYLDRQVRLLLELLC